MKPIPAKVPSGISCCGELNWGTHFCHFYETCEDMIDTLVPFFKMGLANNERCLWITSEPLTATDATQALAVHVPHLYRYVESGQLQIADHSEWYTRTRHLDADGLLQSWVEAEEQALAQGFAGIRINGNIAFIKSHEEWCAFEKYDARVSGTLAGRRIIGLCSFHLGMANGRDVIDVVRNHQFAIARRENEWEIIENAAIKVAKQELHRANQELETRIAERTAEIRTVLSTVESQKQELEIALHARDESQRQLEAELSDATLLHNISATLINENIVGDLYEKLIYAASQVMHSDYASMQRYYPDRDELELLANRGFGTEAAEFWKWVRPESSGTCSMALRSRERVIVSNVEACDLMAGSEDLIHFRKVGIRACQTTPLLSRDGALVGMLSTHWNRIYKPSARDLRLLDIIARQAADLIERNMGAEALRIYTEQLIEADHRKNEFLATLAHELRNPLAPIQTGLAILKMGESNTAVILSMMERQLIHMVRLIDDLLDVSRISRGMLTLKRERVELRSVVDNAIETSQPLLEAAGHEFTVTLPGKTIWLDIDKIRVAQVLSNLLNNAAKYTPRGGRINFIAECKDNKVRLSITDNGIGIPENMLPKIFDLFTQVDRSSERSQSGLGVGLSLAKQFVEMHDGLITVVSEGEGCGSTFTIHLPVAETPTEYVISVENNKWLNPSSDLRILIVDDNVDAAETLGLLLKGFGCQTAVVCDALEAIGVALHFKPDVAFLDLGMPNLNGFDLSIQMRQRAELKNTVLIALSGWGAEEDRARSREAGINHHLTKPVLVADLQAILSGISGHK